MTNSQAWCVVAVEEIAREERKTLSAVIQEALKISRKEKLKKEFYQVQN